MKIQRVGDAVKISGVVDEHSDFSGLLGEASPLTLDLSGIERINSIGLRSWMRFMTQWGEKPITYRACPVEVVDHLAVIPALMGIKKKIATVESADFVFECTKCSHQEDRRLERSKVVPNQDAQALSPKCGSCGSSMALINDEQLSVFSS